MHCCDVGREKFRWLYQSLEVKDFYLVKCLTFGCFIFKEHSLIIKREYCKWIYAHYLQVQKLHNFISRRGLGLTDILIIMYNQKQKPRLLMTLEYLLNGSKHRFGCQVLIRRPIWCQIAIIFTLHATTSSLSFLATITQTNPNFP